MKIIKKIVLMSFLLLILVGCSKTVTCSECGKTKKGKTYTAEYLGETTKVDICDDCIEIVKPMIEALGGTIK